MILIVSTNSDDLKDRVYPRFGRTPWFIKFDTITKKWQALENKAVEKSGGAGVAAAQFLINQGAQAAISGRFGPNAHQALSAGNIKMYTFDNDHNTVEEVIDAFLGQKLTEVK
jgi:predicted Fe-Mo cluster-binding NifX family protein